MTEGLTTRFILSVLPHLFFFLFYMMTTSTWSGFRRILYSKRERCVELVKIPTRWVNQYLETFFAKEREQERKDKLRAKEFIELIKAKQATLETCRSQISHYSDVVQPLDENVDIYNYSLQDSALPWMTYSDTLQSELIKLRIEFEMTLPAHYVLV